jgi:hypothetical protein
LASIQPIDNKVLEFCFKAHDMSGVGTLKRGQIGHLLRNLLSGRVTGDPPALVGTTAPAGPAAAAAAATMTTYHTEASSHPHSHKENWPGVASSRFQREESMAGMSMAFASFCVIDDGTAHLEDRLYELFGTVGSGSVGFETFQRLFVMEPTLHKALCSPLALTKPTGQAAVAMMATSAAMMVGNHPQGSPTLHPIASMQFGMTMEEFAKGELLGPNDGPPEVVGGTTAGADNAAGGQCHVS